jgi:putative oxidoreductase
MRTLNTLARAVVGGYLAVHGAQKLFGSFGGPGLDAVGKGFESIGLTPGHEMAVLAGGAELGGGLLMATGIADPLGPLTIAGTMAVAATTHRKAGPLGAKGGFELPLTNLAFAVVAAGTGASARRMGPRLPRRLVGLTAVGVTVGAAAAITKMLRAAGEATGGPAPVAAEEAAVTVP